MITTSIMAVLMGGIFNNSAGKRKKRTAPPQLTNEKPPTADAGQEGGPLFITAIIMSYNIMSFYIILYYIILDYYVILYYIMLHYIIMLLCYYAIMLLCFIIVFYSISLDTHHYHRSGNSTLPMRNTVAINISPSWLILSMN